MQTSTNSGPTDNNNDNGNPADDDGSAANSVSSAQSGPNGNEIENGTSTNQTTNTSAEQTQNNTDTTTPANTNENMTGDANGDTDAESTGTGETTTPDANNEEPGAESEGNNESNEQTDNSEPADGAVNLDTQAGQAMLRLQLLTTRTVLDLHNTISQGLPLTDQQLQCLGDFNPALGESPVFVDCEQPLATGTVPIYAVYAGFNNSPQCQDSISAGDASACELADVQFRVNTIWKTPPDARRPIPTIGSYLGFEKSTNRVTLLSLDEPLSFSYECVFDATNGNMITGSAIGDCNELLGQSLALIDEHLQAETLDTVFTAY